ncbi:Na+/H+ antiporter subunit E [Paracoccus sp. (in: a-proteobacteria)]|uniref:Na+/H+ antiporter subunit E n=1 Tax=Paracoccus sp. TaxID=267 RepID=UPI0026E0AF0E|nr:Na+/H+ antiporter subunit E [Paracoccus sp. (in: a-proteobacteria)]MDO5368742.1 Na+/H+ antiporter subunit E [Paracoccus sp. (in: a-proteobacteria)]
MTLFPHPIVTVVLTILWMVLTSFTPGQFVLAVIAGILGGLAYRRLTPERIMVRRPRQIIRLFFRVGGDIIRSNIAVAGLILTQGRGGRRRAGFVPIPLDMTNPNGLAVLAIIVTATPGTAWIEYEPRKGLLLLHVFDLLDEDDWVHTIKTRYESLLMEIFE